MALRQGARVGRSAMHSAYGSGNFLRGLLRAETGPVRSQPSNMVCTAEGAIDAWSTRTAYDDAVDKRPDALVYGHGPEQDHVATTATTPGEVGHALIADPANALADGEAKHTSAARCESDM
eukprot:COSAG02_NODE_677_length_18591_cov_105.949221_13_plen_121_part_00